MTWYIWQSHPATGANYYCVPAPRITCYGPDTERGARRELCKFICLGEWRPGEHIWDIRSMEAGRIDRANKEAGLDFALRTEERQKSLSYWAGWHFADTNTLDEAKEMAASELSQSR